MNLKPNEEIQVGALTAAVVYGIFASNTPNLADVKAAPVGNKTVHSSTKAAAWTATAVVAGLSLLSKSPTVFVVGSAMVVAESWKLFHANATDVTGAVDTAGQ
jgi:hypothetical protein